MAAGYGRNPGVRLARLTAFDIPKEHCISHPVNKRTSTKSPGSLGTKAV